MAMLAEPRQKKRYHLVPRGKALYEDDTRFGTKMLEKMGWSKGKGLGPNENGEKDFVRVRYKNDINGLGFEERDDQWTQHEEQFTKLLKSFQSDDKAEDTNADIESSPTIGFGFKPETKPEKIKDTLSGQSLEEKSKNSRARVHYKKFTRGKDIARYSEKDLANIFGKKVAVESTVPAFVPYSFGKEAEPKEEIKDKKKHGVQVIEAGVSIGDYFKQKMEQRKMALLGNSGKKSDESTGIQEISEQSENEENGAAKKKKSKKKKQSDLVSLDETEKTKDEFEESNPAEKKKSKKKRKSEITLEEAEKTEKSEKSNSSEKKNPSKRKISPLTDEISQESILVAASGHEELIESKKKKQLGMEESGNTQEIVEQDGSEESNHAEKKKKSKKKRKSEKTLEETEKTEESEESNSSEKKNPLKRKISDETPSPSSDEVQRPEPTVASDHEEQSEEPWLHVTKKEKRGKEQQNELENSQCEIEQIQGATLSEDGSTLYITKYCAEKFRQTEFQQFKGSNLADISGYGIGESVRLEVRSTNVCNAKITRLYALSANPNNSRYRTSKMKNYYQKVKAARLEKRPIPKLNANMLKRRHVFTKI